MNCISCFDMCWSSFNRQKGVFSGSLCFYGNTSERHLLESTTKQKLHSQSLTHLEHLAVEIEVWANWQYLFLLSLRKLKWSSLKWSNFFQHFAMCPQILVVWVNEATQHKNSNNIKFLAESNRVLLCFVECRKTKPENKIRQIPFHFSLFFFSLNPQQHQHKHHTKYTPCRDSSKAEMEFKALQEIQKGFAVETKTVFFSCLLFLFLFLFSWWFFQIRTKLVTDW